MATRVAEARPRGELRQHKQLGMFDKQHVETRADKIARLETAARGADYNEPWAPDVRALLDEHAMILIELGIAKEAAREGGYMPDDYADLKASYWEEQARAERAEAKLRPGWYATRIGWALFWLFVLALTLALVFPAGV